MMKTIEIIGYKRANLGKADAKSLREAANVPCVLYGGKTQMHLYVSMAALQPLLYTPDTYFVSLAVNNKKYRCIVQDAQFHPVSEIIMHIDFLEVHDDKPVKIAVPVACTGNSPGVSQGGLLVKKLRKLTVLGLPKHLPERVEASIEGLELGGTVQVKDVSVTNVKILNQPLAPVAKIEIPRALRSKRGASSEAEGETEA